MTPPYHNQQLFSDHYLHTILPQRQDWQSLIVEAQPVMQEIVAIFKKYKPSGKEAQAEYRLVRPVLEALGHTFEVQPSLITPDGTKTPDYVFYRNEASLEENKGKKLTEALLDLKKKYAETHPGEEFPGIITIQGDRRLKYQMLNGIILASSQAGYSAALDAQWRCTEFYRLRRRCFEYLVDAGEWRATAKAHQFHLRRYIFI